MQNFSKSQIRITEILPNPKGKDTTEWIELTNFSKTAITIDGHIIDDLENDGSKPYTISNLTLEPNKPFVLNKTLTKLNLNNDKDEISLYDKNQTLIDKVEYKNPIEDKSYSLTEMKSENGSKFTYQWADQTPEKLNTPFYFFAGTVIQEPQIKTDFEFEFQPDNSTKTIKVAFSEETLDFSSASIFFKQSTQAKLLLKKTAIEKTQAQAFELVDYKIETANAEIQDTKDIQQQTESSSLLIPFILVGLVGTALTSFALLLKILKKPLQ